MGRRGVVLHMFSGESFFKDISQIIKYESSSAASKHTYSTEVCEIFGRLKRVEIGLKTGL